MIPKTAKGVAGMAIVLIAASWSVSQDPPRPLPNLTDDTSRPLPPLPPRVQPIHLASVRGMDWLERANQPDGKFLPGFLPALAVKPTSDPFMPQTEAALALLRAARFHGADRAAVLGKQSLLRLLQETTTDADQPAIRFTSAPEPFVNRLAACGGLLQAIHEIPSPPDDLRSQAVQLANYVRSRIQDDGRLTVVGDDPALKRFVVQSCSGPALAGLVAHEKAERRASDRTAAALHAHFALWRQEKNPHMIPGLTAACQSRVAPGATVEQAEVRMVFEMNDWLLGQQVSVDRRQPGAGGFVVWRNGQATDLPADASTAVSAMSLVDACRVARLVGDVQRLDRYRRGLESSLHFLLALQYTESRVQHYADWFRPWVLGAFHNHPHDGDVRLSNTACSTAAMVGYLEHVAR